MDLLEGGDLADVIKMRAPVDEDTAAHYARQMLAALAHVHGHGVAHRDKSEALRMHTSQTRLDGSLHFSVEQSGFPELIHAAHFEDKRS